MLILSPVKYAILIAESSSLMVKHYITTAPSHTSKNCSLLVHCSLTVALAAYASPDSPYAIEYASTPVFAFGIILRHRLLLVTNLQNVRPRHELCRAYSIPLVPSRILDNCFQPIRTRLIVALRLTSKA